MLWKILINDLFLLEEIRYCLKEIVLDVLEDFVKYIYIGNVVVNGENVVGFFKVGCGYEIFVFVRVCCDWLSLRMDCFNVVNILWLVCEENCKEIKVF